MIGHIRGIADSGGVYGWRQDHTQQPLMQADQSTSELLELSKTNDRSKFDGKIKELDQLNQGLLHDGRIKSDDFHHLNKDVREMSDSFGKDKELHEITDRYTRTLQHVLKNK